MAHAFSQYEQVYEKVSGLLHSFQKNRDLKDDSYAKMIRQAEVYYQEDNVTMAREGDRLSNYLLLLEGTARFQKRSSTGRQMTVFRVRGGESCALATACLLSEQPIPAEAVSETRLFGCTIPRHIFLEGLAASQPFRKFVFSGYGEQLGGVLSLASEIAFDPISVRLIKYLLTNVDDDDILYQGHQEIAEGLGTVREVVSREVKALKDKGWVKAGRGKIKIIAKSELSEYLLMKSF